MKTLSKMKAISWTLKTALALVSCLLLLLFPRDSSAQSLVALESYDGTVAAMRCREFDGNEWIKGASWPKSPMSFSECPSILGITGGTVVGIGWNALRHCTYELGGKYAWDIAKPAWDDYRKRRVQGNRLDPTRWDTYVKINDFFEGLIHDDKFRDAVKKHFTENNRNPGTTLVNYLSNVPFIAATCFASGAVEGLPINPSSKKALLSTIETVKTGKSFLDLKKDVIDTLADPSRWANLDLVWKLGSTVSKTVLDFGPKLKGYWDDFDPKETAFLRERAGDMDNIVKYEGALCDPGKIEIKKNTFISQANHFLKEAREEFAYFEKIHLCVAYAYMKPRYLFMGEWDTTLKPNLKDVQDARALAYRSTLAAPFTKALSSSSDEMTKLDKAQCEIAKLVAETQSRWNNEWQPMFARLESMKSEATGKFESLAKEYVEAVKDCSDWPSTARADSIYAKMEKLAQSSICGKHMNPEDYKKIIGGMTDDDYNTWAKIAYFPNDCTTQYINDSYASLDKLISLAETANMKCKAESILKEKDWRSEIDAHKALVAELDNSLDLIPSALDIELELRANCNVASAEALVAKARKDFEALATVKACESRKNELARDFYSQMIERENFLTELAKKFDSAEGEYVGKMEKHVVEAESTLAQAQQEKNSGQCELFTKARTSAEAALSMSPDNELLAHCRQQDNEYATILAKRARDVIAKVEDGTIFGELQDRLAEARSLRRECKTTEALKELDVDEGSICSPSSQLLAKIEREKSEILSFEREITRAVAGVQKTVDLMNQAKLSCSLDPMQNALKSFEEHECFDKLSDPKLRENLAFVRGWQERKLDINKVRKAVGVIDKDLDEAEKRLLVSLCDIDSAEKYVLSATKLMKVVNKLLPGCLDTIEAKRRRGRILQKINDQRVAEGKIGEDKAKLPQLASKAKELLKRCEPERANKVLIRAINVAEYLDNCAGHGSASDGTQVSELQQLERIAKSMKGYDTEAKKLIPRAISEYNELKPQCDFDRALRALTVIEDRFRKYPECVEAHSFVDFAKYLAEARSNVTAFAPARDAAESSIKQASSEFENCNLKLASLSLDSADGSLAPYSMCKSSLSEFQQIASLRNKVNSRERELEEKRKFASSAIQEAQQAAGACSSAQLAAKLDRVSSMSAELELCAIDVPGLDSVASLKSKLGSEGGPAPDASKLESRLARLNQEIARTRANSQAQIDSGQAGASTRRSVMKDIFKLKQGANSVESAAQPPDCYGEIQRKIALARRAIDAIPIPGERGGTQGERRRPETETAAAEPPTRTSASSSSRDESTGDSDYGQDTDIDMAGVVGPTLQEIDETANSNPLAGLGQVGGPDLRLPPLPGESGGSSFADAVAAGTSAVNEDHQRNRPVWEGQPWRGRGARTGGHTGTGHTTPTPPRAYPPRASGSSSAGSGFSYNCMGTCMQTYTSNLPNIPLKDRARVRGEFETACRSQCRQFGSIPGLDVNGTRVIKPGECYGTGCRMRYPPNNP